MPECKKCGKVGPSSNYRKSPKGGHLCLDKIGCAHDVRAKKRGEEPGPRSLQSLLRF